LRATVSLARLLAQQGHRDEARTMLAEIYGVVYRRVGYERSPACKISPCGAVAAGLLPPLGDLCSS
jgi:hypothetical protein